MNEKGVSRVVVIVVIVVVANVIGLGVYWFRGHLGDTYDIDALGIPKFVGVDYIRLENISRISKFRSGIGHDYSDIDESCRSMKHYFYRKDDVDWSLAIYSPVDGIIAKLAPQWVSIKDKSYKGTRVVIRSKEYPAFVFTIFHVNLANSLNVGDAVTAGQQLGTLNRTRFSSDIAVSVTVPRGFIQRLLGSSILVSYFDVMTDSLFQDYQARGVSSRDALIISKEARDADPLPCIDKGNLDLDFITPGNLENWVILAETNN